MPHTYSQCLYHLVFATKHREPLLTPEVWPRLWGYFRGLAEAFGGTLVAAGGVSDHAHLLARLEPDRALSECVRDIKANSSRWLSREGGWEPDFAWQRGYGIFSVSESQAERVRRYVLNQEAHHRTISFETEFESLLTRHGVAFDRDRLWD